MKSSLFFASIICAASAGSAWAQQSDPSFQTAPVKSDDKIEADGKWRANAQAGYILTTGNSSIQTLSGGFNALRKKANNQIQFNAGGAYAESSVYQVTDTNMDGVINGDGELTRDDITTTRAWNAKLRYDRFLTAHNSLYATGVISSDKPAGKELIVGGQAGYSFQVIGTDTNTLVAEIGYDYSYENPEAEGADSFSIHSGRGFLGYNGKLSDDTALNASVEGLANVNKYDVPLVDGVAGGQVDVFQDYRLTGKLAVTTKLFKDISFRFGFEARYDNVPNPLGAINNVEFAPGVLIAADELDTVTDATLIINFL